MENTTDRLKASILETLAQPEEVQTDSGRVKNQSVSQQIKALDYLERVKAEQRGGTAARMGFFKLRNKD